MALGCLSSSDLWLSATSPVERAVLRLLPTLPALTSRANYQLGRTLFVVGRGRPSEFGCHEDMFASGRGAALVVGRGGVSHGVSRG